MSHSGVGCGKQTKIGVTFALEEVGEGNLGGEDSEGNLSACSSGSRGRSPTVPQFHSPTVPPLQAEVASVTDTLTTTE